MTNFGIAIHGGAGTILKSLMTEDRELAYKSGLENALNCGYEILEKGGSSLDAVEAAVKSLENCPLFNAGKGAVFNHDGKQEMDASIIDGTTLNAGAVASVRNVKNPVALARAIMDKSEHVFMCKEGAEQFAKSVGIEFAEDAYFFDAFRFEQYQQALKEDRISLDHSEGKKFGTVGAVALDQHGHLAAATSTGGMTNKKFGRIGDSSIIGAGTYANDATCAISCTGHGELFIRSVVAYDISCLMEYKGLSLAAACELVVQDKLVNIGGEGGLIAIDKMGNICLPFNSEGMYRASKNAQETLIAIYR